MKRTNMPFLAAVLAMSASSGLSEETDRPRVEPDGTVHVPAFDLPESVYLSNAHSVIARFFDKHLAR